MDGWMDEVYSSRWLSLTKDQLMRRRDHKINDGVPGKLEPAQWCSGGSIRFAVGTPGFYSHVES